VRLALPLLLAVALAACGGTSRPEQPPLTAPDSAVESNFFGGRAEMGMILHSYEREGSHVLAVELPAGHHDLRLTRVRVENTAVREALNADGLEKPLSDLRVPYNDGRYVHLTLTSQTCAAGGHTSFDLDRVIVRMSTGKRTVPLDLPVHLSC
jgi:hypothetical protein